MSGTLPADWESVSTSAIARFDADKPKVATRIANRDVLNAIAPHLPELFGGSADLTGSVGTWHEKASRIGRNDWNGNYLSYGVREFVMGTVMNGLALHGGFIPYGGTFLVFSDYARNAIRLSALMKQRLVWVLTHDSIGVGEDGPTHQPVEHVSSLRLIPDLLVWRPCDAVETAVAWKVALESAQPSCMVLTRQGLAPQIRTADQVEAVRRGAYILKDCEGTPEVILIATGSEVQLAVSAAEALAGKGRKARVVSMPCAELFDAQPAEYKENVLPRAVRARVAVEAASVDGWWKYVGLDGAVVGMSGFGESAPGDVLFIDEIHRLNATVEEVLYPAMEDYALDIIIGKGPSAHSIRLDLPHFTLIGATTRMGLLTAPLRDRFGIKEQLQPYSPEDLLEIIVRSAGILDIPIDREGAIEIASRSRGTPRIVNRLLRRVRDYAQVRGEGKIDLATARAGLDMLSIDELGLDTVDRRILDTMIVKFGGRAVGLDTIAAATGDDASTIEDVYEPYLLQLGFIARTPRGRIPMPAAYLHMGYDLPKDATDPRQERMNF